MGFAFRLEDYARYLEQAGEATYLDVTRRTDPARVEKVWDNLRAVVRSYGAPWIVQLWTKDASGAVGYGAGTLEELRDAGTTITAQVTVTGLGGTPLEPLAPSTPFRGVEDLISLAGGADHVKWRYDPVIPTIHRLDAFRGLAERAARLGITRCVVNFLVPPGRYKRVDARLSGTLPGWSEGMAGYDVSWRAETAAELVEAAAKPGISMAACAESSDLIDGVEGLQPAECGDHAWFAALSGRDPDRARTSGSRKSCGCAAYFDVGMYGQWRNCLQCLYCYAG
jgi:hypothetical protein